MCLSLAGVSGSAFSMHSKSSVFFFLARAETTTSFEAGVTRRPREEAVVGGGLGFKGFEVVEVNNLSTRYTWDWEYEEEFWVTILYAYNYVS